MPRGRTDPNANLRTLAIIAFVIAALSVGREVILPLALATLLTFLLSPLVTALQRRRVGRVPAVLAVVFLVFAGLGVLGWIVTSQLIELGQQLPTYQDNLVSRIRALKSPLGAGGGELAETISELASEVEGEDPPEVTRGRGEEPVAVRIVDEKGGLSFDLLRNLLGPMLSPLGTAALVMIFTVFMLMQREDLRDRLIRLGGTQHLNVTTQALDEAGRRVSRYLLMLLIINGSYGLVIAVGLWLVGLPNAPLWGLLAATMRFVPFIGPWLAALMPIALSLAVDDGWALPAQVIALFVILELVSNNVLEPWLFGQGTGVSIVGIIVMASFWTWLWGPLGLVLSMPLTVCLVVLGRYVPRLSFLTILLSDAPALDTKFRYYQRLLALDYHGAGEIVDQELSEKSLEQVYMEVLAPALSLAERDRHSGELVESQREFLYQTIREMVEELGEKIPTEAPADAPTESPATRGVRLWCIPAEDDADEIAGLMVAQLLAAHGYSAEALPASSIHEEMLARVAADAVDGILISAVAPGGVTHARRLLKRIRPKRSELTLIVGLWNATGPLDQSKARLKQAGANGIATTLEEAIEVLSEIAVAVSPVEPDKLEPGGKGEG